MKNCISADKLTMYVDGLLEPAEQKEVSLHIAQCETCHMLVKMFEEENEFVKTTLSAPKLPDTFTDAVLAELSPLKQKRKTYWQRGLGMAAALALTFGITTAVSPSFAGLVGGLFGTSERLDEGTKQALTAGIIYPINETIEGDGRTIKIEDILVDLNRIGFTYSIENALGMKVDPSIEYENIPRFQRTDGTVVEAAGSSYRLLEEDYGYFETYLPEGEEGDQFTLLLDVTASGNQEGEWPIELPIDLTEAKRQAVVVPLEQQLVHRNYEINFSSIQFYPSQTTLNYTFGKTATYYAEQQALKQQVEEKYSPVMLSMHPNMRLTVMNAQGEVLAKNYAYTEGQDRHIGTHGFLTEEPRLYREEVNFEPLPKEPLVVQVDGFEDVHITDVAVPLKPMPEKSTFQIDTAIFTVEQVEATRKQIEISLTVSQSDPNMAVESWALVDAEGNVSQYLGGMYDVQDNGEGVYELNFEPVEHEEALTLVALAVRDYYPLEEPLVLKTQ